MKSIKLCFDFSDSPQLVELLRIYAAKKGVSQKSIVIEALTGYFAQVQEEAFLLSAANKIFEEWDNPEDAVYDTI